MVSRRVKFERQPTQVMFDPSLMSFVVTWSKCRRTAEERLAGRKDPITWVPSVDAIATLYERGCVPNDKIVYAAIAIARAWDSGDRVSLDTESAKKAAELVRDLSCMCVDMSSPAVARDVGHAMRHLLDEMAYVRFMNLSPEDLSDERVMPSMEKAVDECLAIDGFLSWPAYSMRRRFLYCLNRKERTQVAYTLAALLFDTGACPLLSLSDRRTLRMQSVRESGMECSREAFVKFMRFALSKMRDMKASGRSRLGESMTSQQLADAISDSSG